MGMRWTSEMMNNSCAIVRNYHGMTFYQWHSPSAMNQLFLSLQIFVVTFPYMSQETENTKRNVFRPYSSLCHLILQLRMVWNTSGWCVSHLQWECAGKDSCFIHSELLGLDTNPESLKLFIKVISCITETDITAQIKLPRNIIIHG